MLSAYDDRRFMKMRKLFCMSSLMSLHRRHIHTYMDIYLCLCTYAPYIVNVIPIMCVSMRYEGLERPLPARHY